MKGKGKFKGTGKKRAAVGNGAGDNGSRSLMPKTWGEIVAAAVRFGPTAVLLGGVLWWMTQSLDARLETQNQKLDSHMETTQQLVTQIKESNQMNWQLLAVAQRICLNTAKTDSDRLSCVVKPEGR